MCHNHQLELTQQHGRIFSLNIHILKKYATICSIRNFPLLGTVSTVLSRASAHGRSQLKPEKSGVGPYTENLLERWNYLQACAHPRLPNLTRNGTYTSHHHFKAFENHVRVYHRQHHSRISCLQVSVDARNWRRALHSSGDSQHAWPLCSRHTQGYTDNRACSWWNLQSLLVLSEMWGYNQMQSINRQTPSFAVGGRWAWRTLWTDLCSRRSEAIEEAQKNCIYTHTPIDYTIYAHTNNYVICLGLLRPTQSWNKDHGGRLHGELPKPRKQPK